LAAVWQVQSGSEFLTTSTLPILITAILNHHDFILAKRDAKRSTVLMGF
jgi:hypothetical protein